MLIMLLILHDKSRPPRRTAFIEVLVDLTACARAYRNLDRSSIDFPSRVSIRSRDSSRSFGLAFYRDNWVTRRYEALDLSYLYSCHVDVT